ncbi:hypothetical protein BGX27_000267 [Mortierella sp. AM989]|nr:hypothetical protein BGX27_000267 [Mortierella sp. AM989]
MRATTIFLASAAVLAMGTQAQIKGQIAALDSSDSYCFFLPPMVGGDIAANEDKAIAFCNKPNSRAPGAKIFPPGFVLTAHWATGKDWIQITGQIDPAQYSLNPCDSGGQYDIKAPVGASCAGYAHFVNMIEPENGVYGMRCCKQKEDCDVYHSTYGVRRVYGNHNFSGPRPDGPLPLSLKCVNGALPSGIEIPKPSGAIPSGAIPSGAIPSGAIPSGAIPSGALPSGGSGALPSGSSGGNSTAAPTGTATASVSGATNGTTATASSATQKPTESTGTNASTDSPNAAPGKNVMMAATAVLATALGLIMA